MHFIHYHPPLPKTSSIGINMCNGIAVTNDMK